MRRGRQIYIEIKDCTDGDDGKDDDDNDDNGDHMVIIIMLLVMMIIRFTMDVEATILLELTLDEE